MFELTKAQKQIQQAAESFAKGEFDKRLAYEFDKTGEFPADIHKMAAELGFVGIHFPEKYAGGGLGLLEAVLVSQAFCRRDASIGAALALASFGAECLLRFGSDHLKQTFLPKVAEGEMLSAGAFSESQRGGNYAAIKATAETKNRHWIVNGVKTNVINGGSAGFYIVLCRTQPEQANPGEGISMILVEGDRPGIASRTVGRKLGGNLSATAQVTFEAVAVPRDNLLGREGQGILQLKRFVAENGILSAARALGTAMGSFDRAMDYVKQREQFQRKLAAFQVTRHKIADMATKIELA